MALSFLLPFSDEMSVLNRRQPLASTPRNYGAGNDRQIFWTIATRISILMIFFTSFLVVLFFIAHGALMEVCALRVDCKVQQAKAMFQLYAPLQSYLLCCNRAANGI